MKNTRKHLFETNSSSCHSLSIIKEEVYEKWKRGEIVLGIDLDTFDDSDDLDERQSGDKEDNYFECWGNFSSYLDYVSIAPKEEQLKRNLEQLNKWMKYHNYQVPDYYKRLIPDYSRTGVFTEEMYRHFPSLYYTREEYNKSLQCYDCESPFLHKGEGVVIIGHYYHS